MQTAIKEILFKELKKRGVTVYKFAMETGIPKGRIGQWKLGNGNPKEQDIEKIKKWLGQEVSPLLNVPQPDYGMIHMTAADRINELLDDKKVLKESINLSLNAIQKSLARMESKDDDRGLALVDLLKKIQVQNDELSMSVHYLLEKKSGSSKVVAAGPTSGRGKMT